MKRTLLFCTLVAAQFGQTFAATFTVNNLLDSGAGSLRAAIESANLEPGSMIAFSTNGTILLSTPLPPVTSQVTIDGTTAPGFASSPVVSVDFAGKTGLALAEGSDGSTVRALSLVQSVGPTVTIASTGNTIAGNYIGLNPAGVLSPNHGDGISILPKADGNLIGSLDAVESITYYDTSNPGDFTIQPVSAWQGLRNVTGSATDFLICGTTESNGLLYVGPINGGGDSYSVIYPGGDTLSTSIYGPDNLQGGDIRLVGVYRLTSDNPATNFNHGFIWEGSPSDLPSGGTFTPINYPGAVYQYTHSTMGNLAVGNADGPKKVGKQTLPIGPGIAYIYDVETQAFVAEVQYPKSKSNTAYGIWHNGGTSYTICGGYSPIATHNLQDQDTPLTQGKAYLVDYDSESKKFSNWKSFDYQNGMTGTNFITHFEGISSAEPGVYQLNADSVESGSSNPSQGSWVTLRRNADRTFSDATWVDLNYGPEGITSSNSVYGQNVVGVVIGESDTFSYQATINLGFQLSNVISGNSANGISINGSENNIVAMNYIGSDANGSNAAGFGNGQNGVFITGKSSSNLIGGQVAGDNNPTGDKGSTPPVFLRPPQGNLISGNGLNGVAIDGKSTDNMLSGNFIGTDESGIDSLANGGHGVFINESNNNSLIGCTLYQNPFVFYNVISGNSGDGLRINNSNKITVHANFMGVGADNASLVPNGGNGMTVMGESKNTTVGGVIPLGNVISGNTGNGIAVVDKAKGFVSFNTFNGIFAFAGAAPNEMNGTLITSTGGGQVIRTCIIAGNAWNGIHIGGDASDVQVLDTASGTNTDINAAIPNGEDGVLISGTAHNIALGGFKPSVETRNHFSGNTGYGVNITNTASNISVYGNNIGYGDAPSEGLEPSIPNGWGGVLLDHGTSKITIGGTKQAEANRISTNVGGGITILASIRNAIVSNSILDNTAFGIYAVGDCKGTVISSNIITGNGAIPADNVDISDATGITFNP